MVTPILFQQQTIYKIYNFNKLQYTLKKYNNLPDWMLMKDLCKSGATVCCLWLQSNFRKSSINVVNINKLRNEMNLFFVNFFLSI